MPNSIRGVNGRRYGGLMAMPFILAILQCVRKALGAWVVVWIGESIDWSRPAAAFGALIRAFRGARRLFDEIRDTSIVRGKRA
jgi:hypothetical protein